MATTPTPTQDATEVAGILTQDAKLGTPVVNTFLHDAPVVIADVKAGYKTTEFWIAGIGILLTQLGALHLPGKYGDTITTAALALSYILSRGFAKAGASKGVVA
jgi:hypothetical protein